MEEYYQPQPSEQPIVETEVTQPDVAAIAEKYQVMFLHAISPNYVPDVNSALVNTATWQQKLKIDLALNPSLSASTFKEGDSSSNLWNATGIILRSGAIEHAQSQDSSSKATNTGGRYSVDLNQGDLTQDIDEAITQRDSQNGRATYNEFIISKPEVAGFFITRDEHVDDHRLQGFDELELHELAKEIDLPIYIIENGQTYVGQFDTTTKKYLATGAPLHPTEIQNSHFDLTEDQREAIISELAEDSPFKIPEIPHLRSRAAGHQDYMELTRGISYKNTRVDEQGQLVMPKNPKVINTYAVPGGIVEYLVDDGQLFVRADDTTSRWRHEHTKKTNPLYNWEMHHGQAGTHIQTGGPSFNLGRMVASPEDYFQGVEQNITDLLDHRSTQVTAGNEQALTIYDAQLRDLACHIYGFGEQADAMGDTAMKEQAFALAEKALSRESYQQIISKLGEDGRLKINREELKAKFQNT